MDDRIPRTLLLDALESILLHEYRTDDGKEPPHDTAHARRAVSPPEPR